MSSAGEVEQTPDAQTPDAQTPDAPPERCGPGRFRRWVLRPLVWTLALIAVFVSVSQLLLNTSYVRGFLVEQVTSRLGERLDRKVTLDDVAVQLVPLSIEAWGFKIYGPEEMGSDTPFLDIPWAQVDLDATALETAAVRIVEIRVERPKVYLQFLPDGMSNVLKLRRDGQPPKRGPRKLDVLIDRIEVDRAELLLDQESIRMSISGDAIRARFEGQGHLKVGGGLTAQDVVIRLPNARPYRVALSGKGSIERGLVRIESARATGPGLSARGHGSCGWPLDDMANKLCEIEVTGSTHGGILVDLGYFPDLVGPVEVEGTFAWRPGTFGWRSRVSSPGLAIWDRHLDDVEGILVADRYRTRFSLDRAGYGDGSVTGTIEVATREEGRPVEVDLDFAGVPADLLLADQHIPAGEIASRVWGNLVYRFPFGEGRTGDGHGEVEVRADPERRGIPFAGSFPIRIDEGVVRIESASLQSRRQSLLVEGHFDVDREEGRFDYEVASADLEPLAHALKLVPADEPWPLWLPTAGEGEVAGTLHLSPDGNHETEVRLRLDKVRGTTLTVPHRLSGGFHLDRRGLEPFRMEISGAGSALLVTGRIPLADDDPEGLELDFDAFAWPLETVQPWLDFELPVTGRISGRLDLTADAAASYGRLRAKVESATYWQVPFDEIEGHLDWDAFRLRFDELTMTAPAGKVLGHGSLTWATPEREEVLDVDLLASSLRLSRSPLRAYLPRADLRGEVAARAHVGGTRERPELDLEVEADDVALGTRRLEGRPSRLEVRWADGQAEVRGRLLDMVNLEGGGPFGPRGTEMAFDLDCNDAAGLLELLTESPPEEMDGSFKGCLNVTGEPGGGDPSVELELSQLQVSYRGHELQNLEPVRMRLEKGGLEVDSLYLEERDSGGELFTAGRLSYDPGGVLDLRLQGTLALDWLELYEPRLDLGGRLDLLGRVSGTPERPSFDGQGEVRDGSLVLVAAPDFPHTIEGIGGVLLFSSEAIEIDGLEGELAGGRLRLQGRSSVPRADEPLRYRMQLAGQDLRLYYPEGWLVQGGAELILRTLEPGEGRAEGPVPFGYLLQGRADLESLEYTQDVPLGFAQVVQEAMLRQRLEVAQAHELLSAIQLNVVVEAPKALHVRNNLADLDGTASFVIRGNLAAPVLDGVVDLAPGGKLVYSSIDYEIDRGRLSFANPYQFDPEVDLVATTRVRDFDVTLTLSGTADKLNAGFSSEPPLPALEVFRLLATGGDEELEANPIRRADELGQEQSMSAASFLYGQAASVIGERVSTLFGFDKFRIDPLTGSGDNLSTARVTVGKRLSKDVFVSYSADPASTEEQRLRIEWQVGRGLVLVLTQNGDNTYEADARWERSF